MIMSSNTRPRTASVTFIPGPSTNPGSNPTPQPLALAWTCVVFCVQMSIGNTAFTHTRARVP